VVLVLRLTGMLELRHVFPLVLGMAFGSFELGETIVLWTSGARTPTGAERRRLENVVREVSIASNLVMPELRVIDDPAGNLFATQRDEKRSSLVVTTGLLQMLDREELQGVVAHELAHVRTLDTRFKLAVVVLVYGLPFAWDALRAPLDPTLGAAARAAIRLGIALYGVLALLLAILTPFFALAIRRAIGTQREFLADATAVELTRNPAGLERALQKLARDSHALHRANRATRHLYFVDPSLASAGARRSSHPSIDDRISRLQRLRADVPQATAAT
jgi:heat shock protein HtpX